MQIRSMLRSLARNLAVATAALAVAGGANSASAQNKVLRIPMSTDGPGTLDPVAGSTQYENRICSMIYETLLQYKYLKRPLELEPLLLEKMPEVSADGKTWSFRLKKGVRFTDDPCFPGGKGREMVAKDVFYSWKRLTDPAYEYENWWLLENTIVGFDAYKNEQAKLVDGGAKFNYDAPVEGLVLDANDPYAFKVILTEPVQQFAWKLAMFQTSIVPREAVEHYGSGFNGHPVGTGPFYLKQDSDWQRGTNIAVYRSPSWRGESYPNEFMPEDAQAGLSAPAGKPVPFVDKIEVTFFVEAQPGWLKFKAGEMDFATVPIFGLEEAFVKRTKALKREWQQKGITEVKVPLLDFIFRGFNMEDPLVGGYEAKQRALRQAICLSMDWEELNEAQYFGLCVVYDGPIPPALDGHPESHTAAVSYRGPDYARAREKLREAGYEIDSRGKVVGLPPIEFYTSRGDESVRIVEMMLRNLENVGIQLNVRYVDFSALIEAVNNKKAPFFSFAWGSDYPDAENNLALFYSKNKAPGSNHFNYDRPEFDRMYEKSRTLPPGTERNELYVKMRDMLIEDSPYAGSLARQRQYVLHPWLKNFKPTEDFYTYVKYLDVDMNHKDRR